MKITSITSNNVMPNHLKKIHKMLDDLWSRWYSPTYKIIPVSFLFQKIVFLILLNDYLKIFKNIANIFKNTQNSHFNKHPKHFPS